MHAFCYLFYYWNYANTVIQKHYRYNRCCMSDRDPKFYYWLMSQYSVSTTSSTRASGTLYRYCISISIEMSHSKLSWKLCGSVRPHTCHMCRMASSMTSWWHHCQFAMACASTCMVATILVPVRSTGVGRVALFSRPVLSAPSQSQAAKTVGVCA